MVAAIGWQEILSWRMRRQFLSGPGATSVGEVVRRLVAVPSWSGDAELAIGSRMRRPHLAAVAAAFAEGHLVKTFAFRGSMNYLVPEDAGIYLALRAVGRQWELKSWREFYRLEPADWPVLRAVVRDALSSGPLSQRDLADVVVRDARFSHLTGALTDKSCTFLKPLAWQGDLSLAPPRDGVLMLQSPTVAFGWSGIPGTRACRAARCPRVPLRLRARVCRPPAVLARRWPQRRPQAHRGWIARMMVDEIVTIDVEGDQLLCDADHVDELASEPASGVMHLLPGLDPWLLGAGTADAHIVPPDRRREITRGANPVLIDGRVEGTWKITEDLLTVTTHGRALSRDALEIARGRLAEVLGREIHSDGL